MPSYVTPLKNSAFVLYVGLVSQGSPHGFQANPTIAAGDFKVSIDGGTLNNLTTLPTVTPASGKMVKISLSAAEMNGDNVTVVASDAAGAEWDDLIVNIQTTARQIDDLLPTASYTAAPTAVQNRQEMDSNSTKLANLDATVSSRLASASYTTPPTVAQILAGVVEGTITVQQALRVMLGVLAGKSNGGGTSTIHFRDTTDAKNRVTATVDSSGNRSAVTIDAS